MTSLISPWLCAQFDSCKDVAGNFRGYPGCEGFSLRGYPGCEGFSLRGYPGCEGFSLRGYLPGYEDICLEYSFSACFRALTRGCLVSLLDGVSC